MLALQGDDQALARLMLRCREAMLVRVARLAPGLDHGELEDVVGDSLLAAIGMLRAGRWRPEQGSFLGWLDQVVRHDLIDAVRRRTRAPAATDPQQLDGLAGREGPGPATQLLAGEQELCIVAAVRRALAAINPRYADVLLLRAVLGLDVDDVAKELGMQRRQVIDAAYEGRLRLFVRLERGAADWEVFVQHVAHRVVAETPAAVRALLRPEPPAP
jgi:RNA polymerase sigma factor (sigma-70 family)